MLRQKDLNRKDTNKKTLKCKKKILSKGTSKENKSYKCLRSNNKNPTKILDDILKNNLDYNKETKFGVGDIKDIFIDKNDFFFTKKKL